MEISWEDTPSFPEIRTHNSNKMALTRRHGASLLKEILVWVLVGVLLGFSFDTLFVKGQISPTNNQPELTASARICKAASEEGVKPRWCARETLKVDKPVNDIR